MGTVLEIKNITKSFTGNTVLTDVSFAVEKGEIHALIGENGAGKSTLINIVGGIHQPDSGEIILDGQVAKLSNPVQAMNNGISIVHQELSLVPNLSVAQNIFSNGQKSSLAPRTKVNSLGFIQWDDMFEDTTELLERVGLGIDPKTMVGQLSISEKQLVEIAKALSFNAKVLILDEPTSSLSETEAARLFDTIRELTEKGVAIIFISHKLTEVFEIADRLSVLRDGHLVGSADREAFSRDSVIRMMVGRHIEDIYPESSGEKGEEIFKVEGLKRDGQFEDISFSLHRGEILGFAGLVGSGRTEVARAIFGADKLDAGKMTLNDQQINVNSPDKAINHGICYLTEDRKTLGLFLQMLVRENIIASSLKRFLSSFGFLKSQFIKEESARFVELLDIRPQDDQVEVINLSGGNQQKALLAKWISAQPKVLITDEPTRGVDVGAKAQIHQHLRAMADDGVGVIVISSELPEVLGLSDRVAVFSKGRIAAILSGEEATQEEVMKYATV